MRSLSIVYAQSDSMRCEDIVESLAKTKTHRKMRSFPNQKLSAICIHLLFIETNLIMHVKVCVNNLNILLADWLFCCFCECQTFNSMQNTFIFHCGNVRSTFTAVVLYVQATNSILFTPYKYYKQWTWTWALMPQSTYICIFCGRK